jgi:hypothetical protein
MGFLVFEEYGPSRNGEGTGRSSLWGGGARRASGKSKLLPCFGVAVMLEILLLFEELAFIQVLLIIEV